MTIAPVIGCGVAGAAVPFLVADALFVLLAPPDGRLFG